MDEAFARMAEGENVDLNELFYGKKSDEWEPVPIGEEEGA